MQIDFGNSKIFLETSFDKRYDTYVRYVLEQVKIDGLCLEFGVATGETTKKIIQMLSDSYKPLYGFDSFMGLPEAWSRHDVGAFSTNGLIPHFDEKEVKIIIGMFEDALPKFLLSNKKNISLLVVDCDLYSSTKTIFDNCEKFITEGTIIMFDELYNGSGIYEEWYNHEYKAFMEFVERNNIEYEWIAHVKNADQASCIIKKFPRDI